MIYNTSYDFRSHLHAIRGRHHRGHGHERGASFWGGGDGDFPRSRKLSSQDLQLLILALIAEAPAHGYDLIRQIEEKSGGFYAPSPGVIYPSLAYLDDVGHACVEADGNRKRYRITEPGREHLAANRAQADAILDGLGRVGSRMDHVRDAFAGLDHIDPAASDDLHRARHALKDALARQRGASPADMRRMTEILDRATAEILGLAANHRKES